jgi:hypothetical protein
MTRQALQPWLATAAIPLLLISNHLWFRHFGNDYLRWYVNSGALVGAITAVFAAAWGDMDKNVLLISPRPTRYISGCLLLVSLPMISLGPEIESLGRMIGRKNGEPELTDAWIIVDAVIMIPWLVALLALLTLWIIVIAPLQYFAFLVCGALPRSLRWSPQRVVARTTDPGDFEIEIVRRDAPIAEGWWDASLCRKPVTLTAGLSSLVLLGLRAALKM